MNRFVSLCFVLLWTCSLHQVVVVTALSHAIKKSPEVTATAAAAVASTATPKELIQLARTTSFRKQLGSRQYTKAWRHWSELTIQSIRDELSKRLPHPVDEDGFQDLWFRLGIAADEGTMPSFADAGSRAGYVMGFFCRSRLLADLLIDIDNPTLPTHWKDILVTKGLLVGGGGGKETVCRISSLGGGPGFDFVAAALVSLYRTGVGNAAKVNCTVFDYEEGWEDLVSSMNVATRIALQLPDNDDDGDDGDDDDDDSSFSCHWGGKCDITQPMNHPSNGACRERMDSTDLWICQYCISENAKRLRETDFIFFRDLFRYTQEGSLFLFTETTPRIWPDLYDVIQRDFSNTIEVSLLRNTGRSKQGPQLALVKKQPSSDDNDDDDDDVMIRPDTMLLIDEFRKMAQFHEHKLQSGWKRQSKKIRGKKE